MATQDNLAISQSQFNPDITSLTLISEKDKKKQAEDLAHLAAVLQTLEKDITSAKAGVAPKKGAPNSEKIVNLEPSTEENGTSDDNIGDALAKMVMALQMLQVKIVKFGQERANLDQNVAQSQKYLSEVKLVKTIQNIQKMSTEAFWSKIAEWFVALVSAVAAVITMNPELFVITALSVLAATGALSEATKGLTDAFEAIMPKEAAKVLASIVMAIVIIICSFGMGAMADAALLGEDAASVATTETTESASEGVVNGAADSQTALQKVGAFLKEINLFNRLSPRTNTMLVATVQAISSTGLISNVAEACMSLENLSEKEKKKIEEILSMVVAVIAALITAGAGAGAAGSASSVMKNLTKNAGTLFQILNVMQSVGKAGEGAANITRGVFEKELADITADMQLLQAAIQMNTEETSEDQKNMASVLKGLGAGDRSISKLLAGEAAFAQVLTTGSPV